MSHAAAFGIGVGIGFAVSVLITFVLIRGWFARPGYGRALTFTGVMLVPPLIGALLMPDFKTGLLLWIGSPVGFALSYPITLPMRQLAKKRGS